MIQIPLKGRPLFEDENSTADRVGETTCWPFLAGPENYLVETAVESVLEETAPHFSPLFLSGRAGTGKSHLAIGLTRAWKASHPRRSAIYVTAADFARELTDAIETQTVAEFRSRYRDVALLVLEDLDHLGTKPTAQQELIRTLDVLRDKGSRSVVTAHSAPGQLMVFDPRLRGRLTAGLHVPLALPSLQTRMVFLEQLSRRRGVALTQPMVRMFAQGSIGCIPELSGTFIRWETTCRLEARPFTAANMRAYLEELEGERQPSLRTIAVATARHFSLRLKDLRSASRTRAVVFARSVAMYLARNLTRESLNQIGKYFGGRDHTTVAHACKKTEQRMQSDVAIRSAVLQLQESLVS